MCSFLNFLFKNYQPTNFNKKGLFNIWIRYGEKIELKGEVRDKLIQPNYTIQIVA